VDVLVEVLVDVLVDVLVVVVVIRTNISEIAVGRVFCPTQGVDHKLHHLLPS
jgi:hypothetical protein